MKRRKCGLNAMHGFRHALQQFIQSGHPSLVILYVQSKVCHAVHALLEKCTTGKQNVAGPVIDQVLLLAHRVLKVKYEIEKRVHVAIGCGHLFT